ncbi:metal ABC transporter ATP-binding protein [uncultured Muribaculum sp.]|uniref:metal ABC transporter ATP-binding protein n=1 Tax=uncultured Muribaculum sp. TaxID=1918613 RepID=UPI002604BA21|nr:ATP-binding cassette domain-containing protein [uncultured Muribaculum sp.]
MSEPMIELCGVGLRYDRRPVFSGIDLKVERGDFMAITGPNGGGKTSLLRLLLKLMPPTSGRVVYRDADGREVRRLPIGYLPQKNMVDARFPITVREVIASGLLPVKGDASGKRRLVDDTIALMGLEDRAQAAIGELSGGQLQRTLLGRALISGPELLVLDEPLSYIDKRFEHRLYDIIGSIARSATIVLVSHEMSAIAGMANRHIIVDHSLHECGAAHHYVPSECDE